MTTTQLQSDSPPRAPIDGGLFTSIEPDGQLIGSQCRDCAHMTFPRQMACPGCGGSAVDPHPLSRRGTLWTWTVQNFRPKPPFGLPEDEKFEPYGVGYIELPGELRVEARLTVADTDRLRIGMPMELTFIDLWVEDGQQLVTFAFAPIDQEVPA